MATGICEKIMIGPYAALMLSSKLKKSMTHAVTKNNVLKKKERRMLKKIAALLLLVGFMTGCATNHVVTQPLAIKPDPNVTKYEIMDITDNSARGVPGHLADAIAGYIKTDLRKAGMLSDKENPPTSKVNTTIETYRMRNGFNRAMFGMMAGKDGVGSKVTVTDATTGALIGESAVSTYNVTAVGDAEDIAQMHGEEIAEFLTSSPEEE